MKRQLFISQLFLLVVLVLSIGIISYKAIHLRTENRMLRAQADTLEHELPKGVMKALSDKTVLDIDVFCSDWSELRNNEDLL